MGVNKDRVPGAGELTAHIRVAADASARWLDKTARAGATDREDMGARHLSARVVLMRGLERGELLGWVLERDVLAAQGTERAEGLRQAAAYWREARPDLQGALDGLRRAATIVVVDPAARQAIAAARRHLDSARDWLSDLADGLAVVNKPLVEVDLVPTQRSPEESYGRDVY